MIVKDEAPVITRALDSMKHIMDSCIICDTGSSDGTENIIEGWGILNDRECMVLKHDWKNFGYNKSWLWERAHELSSADYFVWLDADEVWLTNPSNNLSYPVNEDKIKLINFLESKQYANIFMIQTLFGNLKYMRWNICRNNQLYKWEQPVHEYLVGTKDNITCNIDFLYLLARKEGNSSRNPDRYKHDAQMFLDFLTTNPNEPRATFYLAQTYESFDGELANTWYKKRVELEGYYQERYIACLRLGRRLKNSSERIMYLMKGIELIPERLECYYEAMMIYHDMGKHRLGSGYAMMAPKNRVARVEDMFTENEIYDYKFDLFMGIVCYYANYFDIGYEATKRALDNNKCDNGTKELLKNNLRFFTDKITQFSNSPKQQLIVIENFYDDPITVRNNALKLEYNVKGNFPGFRTTPQLELTMKQKFESIIGRKITYWPEDMYNGSFQYTTGDMKSWIHRDMTEWSAIVFLTPDAPTDAGTLLYKHKPTGKYKAVEDGDEDKLNESTYRMEDWEEVDKIGNKFNRCILFRGKNNHISGRYFGNSKEDGRLFQTFFFND